MSRSTSVSFDYAPTLVTPSGRVLDEPRLATYATLRDRDTGAFVGSGMAMLHKGEPFDLQIGNDLAFARAILDSVDQRMHGRATA